MVEINNQHKAFLDMLAWSEELITDVRKPEIMVMTSLWAESCCSYSDHPHKLVTLNPKLNQQAPDATSFFPLVGCHRKQLGLKDFSPKSQDAVTLQQIKERGALPMIDRGDIRQAIDRCNNIWALHRALVMVSSSIRLTAWLQNSKKRAGRSERLMYEQSHRDYLHSDLSASSSACHGLLIITVITPLPTRSPARQKCQRTEAGERGNYWHADASAWCCCARCKIHEGVSWC